MDFQTPTGMNYKNGEPTPRSAYFLTNALAMGENTDPDMLGNVQFDPIQLTEESCDLSQYCQPRQAEHVQYHTPSETMSSPDGSVGQLTPSPKKKAKSLSTRRQSTLRNQYIPSPTVETHNTAETPDDINGNSACDMSAEAMSMAGNNQANSGVTVAQSKFTTNNQQSTMGLHSGQNVGYQNAQQPYNPHAPFHPLNKPYNTGHMMGPIPSNLARTNSTVQFHPQQQTPVIDLEADNVNPFDADSMVRSITSKSGRTNPNVQFNPRKQAPAKFIPQKQNPVINVEAHNVNSYNHHQTSSPNMMSKSSQPVRVQKETLEAQQKARYFHRFLKAMKDCEHPEDNPGMLDTWHKEMYSKPIRMEQVCRELVEKVYQAQAKYPLPVGEGDTKTPIILYEDVEERASKLESVLTTQKTVCKHLLAEPYINQVATNPDFAQSRVENNRRVNYGKQQDRINDKKALGILPPGKGVPLRTRRKARSHQEESGDECQKTSGNTNNSPENQGTNRRPRPSATKRTRADRGDEDDVDVHIKESPSKRVKKNAHGRTKSASALTIDTVAASPQNTMGAPRASGHQHSNSYPGSQPMSGHRLAMAETPQSGLPLTVASPYANPGFNHLLNQFEVSPGMVEQFYHDHFNEHSAQTNDQYFPSSEVYDMGDDFQSLQGDN